MASVAPLIASSRSARAGPFLLERFNAEAPVFPHPHASMGRHVEGDEYGRRDDVGASDLAPCALANHGASSRADRCHRQLRQIERQGATHGETRFYVQIPKIID